MSNWILTVIFALSPDSIPPSAALPAPTKEQFELIEKLGAEDFLVREEAEQKIQKMELSAYKALSETIKKTTNPEIKFRSSRIISNISSWQSKKQIPTLFAIYNLKVKFSSGREFVGSKEIFKKFFRVTRDKFKHQQLYDWKIIEISTYQLYNYMRLSGFTREDINELIDAMEINMKKLYKMGSPHYEWSRNLYEF